MSAPTIDVPPTDTAAKRNTSQTASAGQVRNESFANPPGRTASAAGAISQSERERAEDEQLSKAHGGLDPIELAHVKAAASTQAAKTEQERLTAAQLLAQANGLNESEFQLLADATYRKEASGVSAGLQYAGVAWYLPSITECLPDEPQNSIAWTADEGLVIALCGHRVAIHIVSLLLRLSLLVATWWALFLILPAPLMEPTGVVFDPIACFLVCSVIGGILGRLTGMPPLFFVLAAAIMWANVPNPKYLTSGIVKPLRSIVARVGLTTILLRSGLAMSWKTIAPAAGTVISVAILPLLAEILAHGFLATSIMDYGGSKIWPFMQAITTAPGAPAVVGSTTLLLRSWGYGNTRGPGIFMVPGALLDMVLGIWGVNFMGSLTFLKPEANLGWEIAKGPVQIIVGVIAGIIAGFVWYGIMTIFFMEAKRLPHGRYSRAFLRSVTRQSLAVLYMMGLIIVFFGYYYYAAGGGCLACCFLGATVQALLTRDESPEEHKILKTKLYTKLTTLWDLFVMPALFSVGASAISVKTMFGSPFVGKAIACIFVGLAARWATVFCCTFFYSMTLSERIISTFVMGGRATAQVALGPLTTDLVAGLTGGGTADDKRYAAQVYDTAIIGVIFMAPIAVTLLTRVAPRFWLTDAEHARIDAERAQAEAAAATAEPAADSEMKPTSAVVEPVKASA